MFASMGRRYASAAGTGSAGEVGSSPTDVPLGSHTSSITLLWIEAVLGFVIDCCKSKVIVVLLTG